MCTLTVLLLATMSVHASGSLTPEPGVRSLFMDLVPQCDLAAIMNPHRFRLNTRSLTSEGMFAFIKRYVQRNLLEYEVTFECLDIARTTDEELLQLLHRMGFADSGNVAVTITGTLQGRSMHVNVKLQPSQPLDDFLLSVPFGRIIKNNHIKRVNSKIQKLKANVCEISGAPVQPDYRPYAADAEEELFNATFKLICYQLDANHLKSSVNNNQLRPLQLKQVNSVQLLREKCECLSKLEGDKAENIFALNCELSGAHSQLEQREGNLRISDRIIIESRQEIRNKTAEISELQSRVSILREENVRIRFELMNMRASKETLEGETQAYEHVNGDLQAALNVKCNELSGLREEHSSQTRELNSMKASNEILQGHVQDLELVNGDLQGILNAKCNELSGLREEHSSQTRELDRMKASNEMLQGQNLDYDVKCAELSALQEEHLSQTNELNSCRMQVEELEAKNRALKDLVTKLSFSSQLAGSVSCPATRPSNPDALYAFLKQGNTAARYQEINSPADYSESHLEAGERLAHRSLWLETYYSEGMRLQSWLQLSGSKDWRDQFGMESCCVDHIVNLTEEKIVRRLFKMLAEIDRLNARIASWIEELREKVSTITENEELIQLLPKLAESNDPSQTDPERCSQVLRSIYIQGI